MREQQLDAPEHGLPPPVHPPEGLRQRPAVAAGVVVPVVHAPEQQS